MFIRRTGKRRSTDVRINTSSVGEEAEEEVEVKVKVRVKVKVEVEVAEEEQEEEECRKSRVEISRERLFHI